MPCPSLKRRNSATVPAAVSFVTKWAFWSLFILNEWEGAQEGSKSEDLPIPAIFQMRFRDKSEDEYRFIPPNPKFLVSVVLAEFFSEPKTGGIRRNSLP